MAERVGFEPTCPFGQHAFEARPLRPLRYLSAKVGPCRLPGVHDYIRPGWPRGPHPLATLPSARPTAWTQDPLIGFRRSRSATEPEANSFPSYSFRGQPPLPSRRRGPPTTARSAPLPRQSRGLSAYLRGTPHRARRRGLYLLPRSSAAPAEAKPRPLRLPCAARPDRAVGSAPLPTEPTARPFLPSHTARALPDV
jgi:hypothetical protein